MTGEQFKRLLDESLVPMFAGTHTASPESSTPRHAPCAHNGPCELRLKPTGADVYRVPFRRSQPFSVNEKRLVETFVGRVSKISMQIDADYFPALVADVPRRAIATFLQPNAVGARTIERIIARLEEMASETYEGRPVVLSVGITGSVGHGDVKFERLTQEDFARVLSNGVDSLYECGKDGRVFTVKCLPPSNESRWAPQRIAAITEWTAKASRVALVLNRNGEILILSGRELLFAKRRGAWRHYSHEAVLSRFGQVKQEVKNAVYETCLDVSFGRTGGCIAVVSATSLSKLPRVLNDNDRLSAEADSIRPALLHRMTKNKPFHKLDRRLRQEIVSLDGATVLNHDGAVVAGGAIVKVPGGSSGGGRKAAAIALSQFGVAVKISADGPMEGFRSGDSIFKT